MDPITLVMLALIGVLIIFMFRNGKKRQAAMQQLQSGLRPGAEVMLQSGIYGTVEEVDEAENRVTLRSGTGTLIVHRNAVSQIIAPVEAADEPEAGIAPDDDPEFGDRFGEDTPRGGSNLDGAPGAGETPDTVARPLDDPDAPGTPRI